MKIFIGLVHNLHNQIWTPSFSTKNESISTLPNVPNSSRKNHFPRQTRIMHFNIGSSNKRQPVYQIEVPKIKVRSIYP